MKKKTKQKSPPNYARWSCKGTGLASSLTLGSQETAPFLVPQPPPPHHEKKHAVGWIDVLMFVDVFRISIN